MSAHTMHRPAVKHRPAGAAKGLTQPVRRGAAPHGARPTLRPAFSKPARPVVDGVPVAAPAATRTMRQITTVEHQGTVIAFARATIDGEDTVDVYYDILDLKVSTEVDDAEWTGYNKLLLPPELRSVGLGIATVPDRDGQLVTWADTQLKAVSDNTYIHLFQQSSVGTLLLNRFVYKRVAPPNGGESVPVLEPAWEVRFQRSGKQDVPDGPKDSQSYTAPDGTPFLEPTLELAMIRGLRDGMFAAQLLPDQTGADKRWQFFAVDHEANKLNAFSYPVDAVGLPDLAGADVDEQGNARPDMALGLALLAQKTETDLTLAGAPTARLFTLHEHVRTTAGDDLMLKRTTRDMLAVPVTTATGERRFATLDFAVGRDGTLARPPDRTVATPVSAANYAFRFEEGTYLTLPGGGSLAIDGGFRMRCWLYPDTDVAGDQYVVSGQSVPADAQSAPYLKVTGDLRVEFGFGNGTEAVSCATAQPVVKPGQWTEVRVGYDDREPKAFEIRINGAPVPVTRTAAAGTPQGKPLAYVANPGSDGFVGVVDGLLVEAVKDGSWTAVGDWPLDEIDYTAAVPTTPDVSGQGNNAQVFGATLVASSAPVPDADRQGELYVDARGLTTYAGLLTFAEPAASGTLLSGADGLVHLYFAGPRQGELDGLFSVAQYDAQSARAVFEAVWRTVNASATQTGAVTFTAARSGVFMNQATVQIKASAEDGQCDIGIDDRQGHVESWRGVPRALDSVIAVLNGTSTHDLADPRFLAGQRQFYDNTGTYAVARLKARSHGEHAGFAMLSRRPATLQLANASVSDIAGDRGLLTLEYTVPAWPDRITQGWPTVPLNVAALTQVLAGTASGYDYHDTGTANTAAYGLAVSSDKPRTMLLIARPGVGELRIGVTQGSSSDRCKVTLEVGETRRSIVLEDVTREQNEFARALSTAETKDYLVAVTDGRTGSVPNSELAVPPLMDLHAWSSIIAAFPEEMMAPDAGLPAQSVPAAIRQGSTLSVDGATPVTLDGPSTLMRAAAASRPSDGSAAEVQDGTANLSVAAVGGGWVRVSPHKAVALSGGNYVSYTVKAPTAEVLATAGDMTAEAWCRPGLIDYGSAPDTLKRPRLATYYRHGSLAYPEEDIRWTIGLWPRPALNFGTTTEVGNYPKLTAYPDCTMQLTFTPAQAKASGTVMTLRSAGVVKNYLRVTVDSAQRIAVWYLTGGTPALTSKAAVTPGKWVQATVTLRNDRHDKDSPVTIALYLNGVLDQQVTLAGQEYTGDLGNFIVGGANNDAFPMRANGTYMWKRALTAEQVAETQDVNPQLADPALLTAWTMTEGAGTYVTNQAISGAGKRSEIVNVERVGWTKYGAYGAPWAANRFFSITAREAVPHGWHHIASSYLSGYALALGGSDYADCGNDASLDLTDTFSVEAYFTPANSGNGEDQGLVSKTGGYELRVDAEGAVVIAVWTDTLGTVEVRSLRGISDYRIEDDVPCYATASVSTGSVPATDTKDPGPPKYFLHIDLYVDGKLRNYLHRDDLEDPCYVQTTVRPLNLGRSALGGAYYSGRLSDVRLWNVALDADTVTSTMTRHEPPSTHGLVSSWRWSEGTGKYGYDDTGLNTAVLTANDLWRLYPATSRLALIVDGIEQTDVIYATEGVDELMYGSQQFTAGAAVRGGAPFDAFIGSLSELRVWNHARTAEQIREDMYRVLTGAETALVGYWEFDSGSGSTAPDATGNGNAGMLTPSTNPPKWIDGRPPLSNEAKEVYNVLGGQITEFSARITGTPSAAEYADTRRDAYGDLYSVMKRSYGTDRRQASRLISGYTVGVLDTVYAGQVQTEPSIVGFIEGAPPIPSENQTNPWWSDPLYWNSYADQNKTRITHAEAVTRTFTGSLGGGQGGGVENNAGFFIATDFTQGVGLGTEIDWTIASAEARLGLANDGSRETRTEEELGFGYGRTTTTVDEISCAGTWEDAGQVLNPTVGRRYVPDNYGYAVVKSLTADMYLDTLRGSNTVVRTVLVPDPDIPEDVNVITFPINPGYVKNGTLDGMVGFVPDPDFPYADDQRGSYFRPVEAYALARAVERQDKQLEAYYRQFATARLSRLPGTLDPLDSGYATFKDQAIAEDPAYDWALGLAKRAIVNKYVWSANGGLHTEQTELVDTRSESFRGLSSSDSKTGLSFDLQVGVPAGLFAELDATFGTSVEVVSARAKENETGFGLELEFAPESFLQAPVLDSSGQPTGFTGYDAPGKVTGYRFMSFLIPQNATNFATLATHVIDQNWLHNSANPDAAALRTATAQTNGVWRVLHRTTYVSRVAPRLQPAPAESTAPPVTEPAGLEGNTLLTRLIEKQITTSVPSPAQIGAAVLKVLGDGTGGGLLANVLPWWAAFVDEARKNPRSDAASTLAALRVDLLAYMVQKYLAAQAQIGGAAMHALRTAS